MLRSIAKLASARIIATAIPFLSAPVLGRLYTPADYAPLTLFLSIITVISVFVTFQMQHSLLLEAGDRAAIHLAWISLALAAALSGLVGLTTGILALVHDPENLWAWMFLLPFALMLIGLRQVAVLHATRRRSFDFISRVLVVQVLTTAVASVLFGYWFGGSLGLFLGFFLGQTVQALQQTMFLRVEFAQTRLPSLVRARALIRRHRDFMIFSTPSALIKNLGNELPIFALSALPMSGAVGALGRARQIISAPINLARGSVSQVFQREAAELYRATGSCRGLMLRTAAWLFAIGIVPTLVMILYGPSLLMFYLGPQWAQAGDFAQILSPMLLARLVTAPTASVFFATGHQRLEAKIAAASFLIIATGVGLSFIVWWNAIGVVAGYAAATTIVYLMYFIYAVRISRR